PGGFGYALYAVKAATGANVWPAPAVLPAAPLSTAAVDAERGLLFVAVGQPPVGGQPAPGPSAVVALQVQDGAPAWPALAVLDHPAPTGLSLGMVRAAGSAKPAVFAAAGGSVTALDATNGGPLWTRSL